MLPDTDRQMTPPRLAAALLLGLFMLLAGLPALAQKVGPSGLPLPRFVILASGEVNVRTGPGKEFPIRWVFGREGYPVKIVEESDDWRKIVDQDGEEGWVHSSLLAGGRNIAVTGEVRSMRRTAGPEARIVARVEPGVVGKLFNCKSGWCFVEIADIRGWLEQDVLWGASLEGDGD